MRTTEFTPANNWPFITSTTLKTFAARRNLRNWHWRTSGASAAHLAIPISPRNVSGWKKDSCTVLHVYSIKYKPPAAWQDRLLFHAPAGNRNRRADTVAVKLIPVFLNSKEEIGWKAQPQNSNLWQEVA